jgi:hypothetical protein
MNDVSDLWTTELIIENKISQVIFLPSRGDTIISNYRLDGQVEIEYLINKGSKDTSTIFYVYEKDLLKEQLHIYASRNDTITYTTYKYENSKLKTVTCENPTFDDLEIDTYFYDEKGNLKKVESIFQNDKIIRETKKEFDGSGRLIKEIELRNNQENVTHYLYEDDKVTIQNNEGNTVIHFNKKGFPISASTKEENRISFQLIYDERGLLQSIENDGKIEAEVKYLIR